MISWPVVMYPEGVVVGKVRSGKTTPGGKVRHVALLGRPGGRVERIGTFDSFSDAKQALIDAARAQHGPPPE